MLHDGILFLDSSKVENLQIQSGTSLPVTGLNLAELFYLTSGGNPGLYVYNGAAWEPAAAGTTIIPGGSTSGSIQFNDAGAFSGDTSFTYSYSTSTVTLGTSTVPGKIFGSTGTGATTGGHIRFSGGAAVTDGGGAIITGGGSTNGNGGFVSITGGTGATSNGAVNITGGFAGPSGGGLVGGTAKLQGGLAGYSGSTGGNSILAGGNGYGGSGDGGNALIQGGVSGAGGGTAGYVAISTAPNTTLIERFRITKDGAWSVGSTGTAYGSIGQVLTSNGNAAPSWVTPASAGASVSASNTWTQTQIFSATPGIQASTIANRGTTSALTIGMLSTSGADAVPLFITGAASTGEGGWEAGGIIIRGGVASGTNSTGGAVSIIGGQRIGAGGANAGAVNITGGAGMTSVNGGSVNITGGASPFYAGSVLLTGGYNSDPTKAGAIVFRTDTSSPVERMRVTPTGALAFSGASGYGTFGQVLTSNGNAAPSWVTPSTANSTITLSGDATGSGTSGITVTLANTAVSVGSYGSGTQVGTFTVDSKGRLTAASNTTIALPTSAITSGTFADTRVAASNVTQHQGALTITEAQITDGTLLARNADNETITGNWAFSNPVVGSTPSSASHLATKDYVDTVATGLAFKASVRATTTANITLTGVKTLDGVSVVAGDRVLVKDQSTGSQNGIYDVATGAWIRSADFDGSPTSEIESGAYVFVREGTLYGNSGWVLATAAPITVGTTSLSFSQFTGLGDIDAGAGLTKTGTTLNVVGTAGRISVLTDSIDLVTAGTAGTYKSVTTDAYGRVTAGTNPTTLAGYGITDAPTKTGTGASGTWGINITGNAATATSATSIAGGSFAVSSGLIASWGATNTVNNTGAFSVPMGDATSATWLLSGFSGSTFRYGIQGLDGGGALRFYSGTQWLAFDGTNLVNDVGHTFLTSANYSGYTVSKTGVGASGTWPISITGSSSLNVLKAGDTMTGALTVPHVVLTSASVPQNGIYLPAANSVGISTNGTESLRIDAAGTLTMNAGAGTGAFVHRITNAQTTATSWAGIYIANETGTSNSPALALAAMGTGYTTNGAYLQDSGVIDTGGSLTGGLSIISQVGNMRFYSGGNSSANLRFVINNNGTTSIGSAGTVSGTTLAVNKDTTGAANARAISAVSTVQSDVTTVAVGMHSQMGTAASSFTLGSLVQFGAYQGGIGAGSTVTNNYGFYVDPGLIGGTKNYGFYGNIASGANRWNTFNAGTAQNFFQGNVGIGTGKTVPSTALDVAGTVTATAVTATSFTGLLYGTADLADALVPIDDRSVAPADISAKRFRITFGAWNNNNSSPHADMLHLRGYQDVTGGQDNLIAFRKDTFGIRQYQQTFGSSTAYSSYKDVAFTDGTGASGTWSISINGTAATATSIAGGSAGGVLYQTAINSTAQVTPGTPGQVLTSNGTSAPTWATGVSLAGANTWAGTQTFNAGIVENSNAISASAINVSLGGHFTKTISSATTFTVSGAAPSGKVSSFILDLTNGGSAAITWFAGVKWAGGTAPTLTVAGRDVLGFYTADSGTTWTGLVLGLDVK